eukprot:12583411-Alexandrium_andersonii.AAC.1
MAGHCISNIIGHTPELRQGVRTKCVIKCIFLSIVLSATDGVECCCNTARAPRLPELTDTGALRVNSRRQPGG